MQSYDRARKWITTFITKPHLIAWPLMTDGAITAYTVWVCCLGVTVKTAKRADHPDTPRDGLANRDLPPRAPPSIL